MKKNILKNSFYILFVFTAFSMNAQTTLYYEDFRNESTNRGFSMQRVALGGQSSGEVGKRRANVVDASDSDPVFDESSRPTTRIPQGGERSQRSILFNNQSGNSPDFTNHQIEGWALMTSQDFTSVSTPYVTFWTQQSGVVGGGAILSVLVSENYTHGNLPSTASWTDETANIVGELAVSDVKSDTYVLGQLDLSAYSGASVTVAFRMISDNAAYNAGTNQHGSFLVSDVKFLDGAVLSTNKETLNKGIATYPNPVSDVLHVDILNTNVVLKNVQIVDIRGKVIYDHVYTKTIDVSDFSSGLYFMKLTSDTASITRKVIVINKKYSR